MHLRTYTSLNYLHILQVSQRIAYNKQWCLLHAQLSCTCDNSWVGQEAKCAEALTLSELLFETVRACICKWGGVGGRRDVTVLTVHLQ